MKPTVAFACLGVSGPLVLSDVHARKHATLCGQKAVHGRHMQGGPERLHNSISAADLARGVARTD